MNIPNSLFSAISFEIFLIKSNQPTAPLRPIIIREFQGSRLIVAGVIITAIWSPSFLIKDTSQLSWRICCGSTKGLSPLCIRMFTANSATLDILRALIYSRWWWIVLFAPALRSARPPHLYVIVDGIYCAHEEISDIRFRQPWQDRSGDARRWSVSKLEPIGLHFVPLLLLARHIKLCHTRTLAPVTRQMRDRHLRADICAPIFARCSLK